MKEKDSKSKNFKTGNEKMADKQVSLRIKIEKLRERLVIAHEQNASDYRLNQLDAKIDKLESELLNCKSEVKR